MTGQPPTPDGDFEAVDPEPPHDEPAAAEVSSSNRPDARARPFDPVGTRPRHEPESLVPQAAAHPDFVDAEAIEEDGDQEREGDLLPERRAGAGASAVATAKHAAPFAPRFQFLTGALVAVGIAALVGITVAIVGIPPSGGGGPAWSQWKPISGGLQGASEIASHIETAYRDQGKQLVNVEANDISYKGVPLVVALRKSKEEGGAIQVHDEKGVLYQMCGLGVHCQIDGLKPSTKRTFLLRRAGLELALYTFRYLSDVKQVVVLIPPASPGKAQTMALYFSRDAVRPELDRPLTSSLLPTAPTAKTVKLLPDAKLVDQTTNPYLFSLMGSNFNQGGYLVLDRYSPAGERALQKRLKEEQKQAATAAATAAATPGG